MDWTGYRGFVTQEFASGLKLLCLKFEDLKIAFTHPGSNQFRVPSSPKRLYKLIRHRMDTKQLPKGWAYCQEGHAYLLNLPSGALLGFSYIGTRAAPHQIRFFWKTPLESVVVHAEGLLDA